MGHTMTAAITNSTRITGRVSSISGIKVGDQVSAQIADSGGKATVTAIQYPAQVPPGMGAP
jgi:Cu/Ag efflux protein CusF